jgi:hypothetical protein
MLCPRSQAGSASGDFTRASPLADGGSSRGGLFSATRRTHSHPDLPGLAGGALLPQLTGSRLWLQGLEGEQQQSPQQPDNIGNTPKQVRHSLEGGSLARPRAQTAVCVSSPDT